MAYGKRLQQKNCKKADVNVWEYSGNDLLEKEKQQMPEKKLTFNITYYPAYQNVRRIMEELHISLTPTKEHRKVFPDVPFISFWKSKSLKDYLVRFKLSKLE